LRVFSFLLPSTLRSAPTASEISWSLSSVTASCCPAWIACFLQPSTRSEPQAQKQDWCFLGDFIVAFPGPLVSMLFNNAI
jgi:hypothetical protein